jgi:transposase
MVQHHHTADYKMSAINYYNTNNSFRETCEIFQCKKSSLQRWVSRYEERGNVNRINAEPYDRKITPTIRTFIKQKIRSNPTIVLTDLVKLVKDEYDLEVHHSTIYHTIDKENITRKRLRKRYYPEKKLENEQEDLKDFYKELLKYKHEHVISIDETSIYLNMRLAYGRNTKGHRVVVKTSIYPFKRYNVLCAIKSGRVVGIEIYEHLVGGVKKDILKDFIRDHIENKYSKHLILIDSAAPHKSKEIRKLVEEIGCKLRYTVPYHPETNPIEEFFSQLKHYVKLESPQEYKGIVDNVTRTIKNKIKPQHLDNYFKHLYLRANKYV